MPKERTYFSDGRLMKKPAPVLLLLLLILMMGGAAAGYFWRGPADYTVHDGAETRIVHGRYRTIADVLEGGDIPVRPEDIVSPALDESADPDAPINIRRARPVTVRTVAGGAQTWWTQQTTLGGFLDESGISLPAGEPIYANRQPVNGEQLERTPLPGEVEIGRFLTVTIQDGAEKRVVRTAVPTVGAALQEAGISLSPNDHVTPNRNSRLTADAVIRVQRSRPYTIQVDGRIIQTRSHHNRAPDIVADAGVTLIGDDYTRPGPETPLQADAAITVIRVTENFRTEDEPLPYQTIWQASDELELDTKAILTPGENGVLRRRLRVRYENGVEVSQTVDGEWVAKEPVTEVVGYGARINLRIVNTPDGPREYWRVVRMRVTSYTAASSGIEPGDPSYGVTASGYAAGYGVVAVDRAVVPFRSYVYVPGYGVGFVGDTGGGVKGRWIDLGYSEADFVPWSGYTDVYYLTPVPPPEDINYLLPEELP